MEDHVVEALAEEEHREEAVGAVVRERDLDGAGARGRDGDLGPVGPTSTTIVPVAPSKASSQASGVCW
jgi:hypothetical protein